MVRASGLGGYEALMRALGHDPGPLLRRYRIQPQTLADEDALLPLRAVLQLLEASAAQTGCGDFGLRLARIQDITVLGPVALAMQHASTVADALDIASRYLFVHSPGMRLTLHPRSQFMPGTAEVRFEIHAPGAGSQRQAIDICLGDVHHILEFLAGGAYGLKAVTLPHTPVAPLTTYSRFYGVPVHSAQDYGGLHFRADALDMGLHSVNTALRQITEAYLATHFGGPEQSVAARTRQALQRTLGTSGGSKASVARVLGMHPRTLQRHLAAEQTSFEAQRDTLRRELAQRYLQETGIPMAQLAGLLGLSEQSALSRACRRWFGQSPSQLRRGGR